MRTSGESFKSNNSFKLGCVDPNETSFSKKPQVPAPAPELSKSNIYVSLDDEFDYMSQSQLFTSRTDIDASTKKDSHEIALETGPIETQTQAETGPTPTQEFQPNSNLNLSMVSRNTEPKDFDCQTLDSRKKFCYNCFKIVDGNCIDGEIQNDGFIGQVFCSKKCLKIQYLENSIFCTNQACEKGHFLKFSGVMNTGEWYCSEGCVAEEKMRESRYGQYKCSGDDQEMVRDYEQMEKLDGSLIESIEEEESEEGDIDLDFSVGEMGTGKVLF